MVDGEPIAQIQGNGIWDSVATAIENDAGDLNLDLNADNTIKASEAAKALMMWEYLRSNNLTEMTYEDYLRTFGVKVDPEVDHGVPELIRYSREWQYPNNVVDPTTGVPVPGLSWGINLRVDKDRYFKEPGFIFRRNCGASENLSRQPAGTGSALVAGWYILAADHAS